MLFNIFSKHLSFSSETIHLKSLFLSMLHHFDFISLDLSQPFEKLHHHYIHALKIDTQH